LVFWKVKIDLNDLQILNVIRDEGGKLKPLTKLSKVFMDGVEHGGIHVVIYHSAIA
jgi:hypothetical protein